MGLSTAYGMNKPVDYASFFIETIISGAIYMLFRWAKAQRM